MYPLASVVIEVEARPCETCARADPAHRDGCPETDKGLTPGWPRHGGRLPAQFLGVGTRCPRWTQKED